MALSYATYARAISLVPSQRKFALVHPDIGRYRGIDTLQFAVHLLGDFSI